MVAPRTNREVYTIPAQATAATDEPTVLGSVPFAGTVKRVTYVPEGAVTGAATNNRFFRLLNRGQAGAGNVEVASRELASGTNLVAFDEFDLNLSATPANLNVAAGDVLSWLSDAQGTGLADPGGTVIVEIGPQGAAS